MSLLLELDDVSISFKGRDVIKNLSLTLDKDTVHCFVGKSGCGKSTLLRAIAGFQKIDSGCIRFNGKEITKPVEGICMVHQSHKNFDWLTCLDNLLMPIKAYKGRVTSDDITRAKDILEHVDLGDSLKKKPFQLSGGMNQRLSLARMLILDPQLALMDEPFGALDPTTKKAMENYIMEFDTQVEHGGKENMLIVITHDLEEAQYMAPNRVIQIGVQDTGELKIIN